MPHDQENALYVLYGYTPVSGWVRETDWVTIDEMLRGLLSREAASRGLSDTLPARDVFIRTDTDRTDFGPDWLISGAFLQFKPLGERPLSKDGWKSATRYWRWRIDPV